MRILQINSHHRIWGGAERYYFGLSRLLREKGHKVAFFSMKDSDNCPTKWDKYFLGNLDFGKNDAKSFCKKIGRMFYSLEAKKKINLILDDFGPDIVHIHNIYYYISPSILTEIKKRGIPIIQTVHDYQLISPNVNFFHDGKICEVTKTNKFYKAVFHKCVKSSYLASLMAVIESYIHCLFRFYERNIDYFIAPSIFMKNKLAEYGFNSNKILHLPNFSYLPDFCLSGRAQKKKYILYFGRLCEQKGIFFLLEVAKKNPDVEFKLAGRFPDQKTEKLFRAEVENNSIRNITLLGFQNTGQLKKTILGSCATIVPSLWYENQPYSILESYALGKPIVAAKVGGIGEVVANGKTGLLFKSGDVDDCGGKVHKLWCNPQLVRKMARNVREYVGRRFGPEAHYERLIKIYQEATAK